MPLSREKAADPEFHVGVRERFLEHEQRAIETAVEADEKPLKGTLLGTSILESQAAPWIECE
jgi:hypothetical protein